MRAAAPPPAAPVLLASEGRPFSRETIDAAADVARRSGAGVRVLTVARIWGTSLGLPMPGLLPTKREWDDRRGAVRDAVRELRRRGVEANGHVVGTRHAAKTISAEAARLGATAIVMGADRPRNRLVADLMWSQEPYRVQRKARVPVYLVRDGD